MDVGTARDFYEQVYWNDLNEWLEKNESRLDCRFPPPIAETIDALACKPTEQAVAPQPQKDAPGAPAKVGAGDAALQVKGEPPMRVGSNPAKAYKPWIVWQAAKLKQNGDKFATLSQRIVDLATERNYRNQGGNEFTLGTVTRNLSETGITGGRRKNGRKSPKNDLARQINPTPNHSTKSTKARNPL